MPLTRPYEEGLYARLQSLTYCVEYLRATKDDDEGFVLALGDIIAAHTQTERAAHAETEARRQESFAHFEDVTQQLTATRDLALELVETVEVLMVKANVGHSSPIGTLLVSVRAQLGSEAGE